MEAANTAERIIVKMTRLERPEDERAKLQMGTGSSSKGTNGRTQESTTFVPTVREWDRPLAERSKQVVSTGGTGALDLYMSFVYPARPSRV